MLSEKGVAMDYFIAWWNLENLFDVEMSDTRPKWLQKKLAKELKGWTVGVLKKKISQLSSIIAKMNEGVGPDILGVCEIESEAVVEKLIATLETLLPDRAYRVVHADTDDARGIDVAFIYDLNLFQKPLKKDVFSHIVLKRNATRDILQVNFKTKAEGEDLVLLGNHWPSRLGGHLESEPYRILAAETISYWIERIYFYYEKEVPIVVMGDFNDEPFNRAMTDYALGLKDSAKVKSKRSKKPYLFNLMWDLQNDGSGTHFYDSWGILDQILVNRPLLRSESKLQLKPDTCAIFSPKELFKSSKPRRFGRPSKKSSYDPEGYSDHLPVSFKVRAKS